jgi:hypothetical protein
MASEKLEGTSCLIRLPSSDSYCAAQHAYGWLLGDYMNADDQLREHPLRRSIGHPHAYSSQ